MSAIPKIAVQLDERSRHLRRQIVRVLEGGGRGHLGTSLSYWSQASDPPAYHQLPFGPTARPGMMTRAEVAARYFERSGRAPVSLVFYYAYGLFKTAVVAQQIYYRWKQGLTQDARFQQMIFGVRLLSEQARSSIERNAI